MGGIDPTLTVLLEAAAFVASPFHAASALNPYQLAAATTGLAISLDGRYEEAEKEFSGMPAKHRALYC